MVGDLPRTLAESNALEVRLAKLPRELLSAQELRYLVFFEEGHASPEPEAKRLRRDVCRFDDVCDHLIVVDRAARGPDGTPAVVGAYRLLRQDVANAHFGFYSEAEFAVRDLMARHPDKRFLELGRSCVAGGYRGKRTLELLWRGIWTYALHHRIDVMFGCASFPGVDAGQHDAALAFLREGQPAAEAWNARAIPGRAAEPPNAGGPASRVAVRNLPPLIKGYWRLGAQFSQDAVIDRQFGTTDVFVVLPIDDIRERYLAYFAPQPDPSELAA